MKSKSKLIVCIIGILIGLALIYVGFTVRGGSYDMVSTSSIGQPNEFCNKYEDEMYNATQDVGHAVNNTTRAVNGKGTCKCLRRNRLADYCTGCNRRLLLYIQAVCRI